MTPETELLLSAMQDDIRALRVDSAAMMQTLVRIEAGDAHREKTRGRVHALFHAAIAAFVGAVTSAGALHFGR